MQPAKVGRLPNDTRNGKTASGATEYPNPRRCWRSETITMVTVLLFGLTLRGLVGESELQLDVSGPMTVKALLEAHADKLAGVLPLMNTGELLVTVNKKVGSLESVVKDGDVVKLTHQAHPIFDGAMWQNP
jgi:molybdopterin synthase sulfur carrier subunit